MSFTVYYHQDVENDVLKAKDWYKNQQKGLEKRFAKQVKQTIITIIKNPLIFQEKHKNVRVAYTKTFPFGVHFIVDQKAKNITIMAVFHTSINPNKWEDRAK
jgi:plasmid stabilization system protein ParE